MPFIKFFIHITFQIAQFHIYRLIGHHSMSFSEPEKKKVKTANGYQGRSTEVVPQENYMLDELSTLHDQFIELSKCLQYGKKEIPCEEVNQIIVTYEGVEKFDSISEDVCDVFNMFIDTCLVHMVPRVTWKKNLNETLTDLFSIADEAFAMLVLENIALDLQSDIIRSAQGRIVWGDRKKAKPKFTKGGRDSQGNMRGWRYEGIVQYNKSVMDVIGWRKKTEL